MANEALLRQEIEVALPFIVADGTGIEKGTLLKITDPMTAAASATEAEALAGIAQSEKIASDGNTSLGVYRRGWFDMKCSGAVTLGHAVISAGAVNEVKEAPVTASGASILGHALETGSDGETILIDVNIGAGGAQIS